MKHVLPTYSLSGNTDPNGAVGALAAGLISCLLLGPLYALLVFYVPFIYILFVFTLAYGILVGKSVGWAALKGNLQNQKIAVLLGFVTGLFAVYVQWVIWLYLQEGAWFFNPMEGMGALQNLALQGVWSLNSWTPTGNSLYGIWALEAAVIVSLSSLMSVYYLRDSIYCEECKQWLDDQKQEESIVSLPNEELMNRIYSGDLEAFKKLRTYKNTQSDYEIPDPYARLTLNQCPQCKNLNVLSLIKCSYYTNAEGELQVAEDTLIDKLLIDNLLYQALI
ncbi:hypothetical protein IPG41_03845 [Candidatus Peregrinibacteria bacterium]|nr:MAG: hypothetical protein IPG41_03845 [Candidatus Peregrinibacteria bacterium]